MFLKMSNQLDYDSPVQMLFIIGLACVIVCIILYLCKPFCKKKIPEAKMIRRIPINCNVYSTDGTLLLVQDEALPLLNNI